MEVILFSVNWKCELLYLDDIIVFSKTVEQYLTHLRPLKKLIRNVWVTPKLNSSPSFQRLSTPRATSYSVTAEELKRSNEGGKRTAKLRSTNESAIIFGLLQCFPTICVYLFADCGSLKQEASSGAVQGVILVNSKREKAVWRT